VRRRKTGFKSTQGVAAAGVETYDSVDGMGEDGRSRQQIVPIDAVLTWKSWWTRRLCTPAWPARRRCSAVALEVAILRSEVTPCASRS
jgi:hypothetical protein